MDVIFHSALFNDSGNPPPPPQKTQNYTRVSVCIYVYLCVFLLLIGALWFCMLSLLLKEAQLLECMLSMLVWMRGLQQFRNLQEDCLQIHLAIL